MTDDRPFATIPAHECKFVRLRGGMADGMLTSVVKTSAVQVRPQGTYCARGKRTDDGLEVFEFIEP